MNEKKVEFIHSSLIAEEHSCVIHNSRSVLSDKRTNEITSNEITSNEITSNEVTSKGTTLIRIKVKICRDVVPEDVLSLNIFKS